MTRIKPTTYQGVRCPYFVFVLSERYPTSGVATPSAIWPARSAEAAAGVLTTLFRKKNK